MVLSVVEAVPASSKPSAGVDVRISPGKIHGFGTSAPSSTRASSRHIMRAEGVAFFAEADQTQLSSTRADVVSLCLARSAAAPSHTLTGLRVCFYVCFRGETWLLSLML